MSSSTSSDSNIYIATVDSKDYLINPIDWNNVTTHGIKDNSIPGSKIISIPVSKIVGDLPGGASKADVDAANLSTSDIKAWQKKLQIDTLDALVEGIDSKQDKLKFYSEEGDDGENSRSLINAFGVNINGAYVSITGGDDLSINGNVSGTAISTSITASETAVDTKLPSEKAVATAISTINTSIDGKADKATTLAGYNIGDAYTKTEVNTELGKKQNLSNLVTEITAESLNTTYPSSKAVYDYVQTLIQQLKEINNLQ